MWHRLWAHFHWTLSTIWFWKSLGELVLAEFADTLIVTIQIYFRAAFELAQLLLQKSCPCSSVIHSSLPNFEGSIIVAAETSKKINNKMIIILLHFVENLSNLANCYSIGKFAMDFAYYFTIAYFKWSFFNYSYWFRAYSVVHQHYYLKKLHIKPFYLWLASNWCCLKSALHPLLPLKKAILLKCLKSLWKSLSTWTMTQLRFTLCILLSSITPDNVSVAWSFFLWGHHIQACHLHLVCPECL